jgi:hypothetical protein
MRIENLKWIFVGALLLYGLALIVMGRGKPGDRDLPWRQIQRPNLGRPMRAC